MLAETIGVDISENLFSEKIYWLNQLSGELPESNVITDYKRSGAYSRKNKSVQFKLDKAVSQQILKLSNESPYSVYLFLLAAAQILLEKYTNNCDLIVGIPVLGKSASIETPANRVLPLRTCIDKGLTFKDALLQVREQVISAYIHQNYAIGTVVQLLDLPQHQNRCSIFDVVVLLENIHARDEISDLNNDLTISFAIDGHSICGSIDYSDSLFFDGTIDAIANYYTNIIRSVVQQPSIQLSDITLLTESDRRCLLEDFNHSHGIYPIEKTISELFEQQVAQTPEHIAAVDSTAQLSYQALNEKANQLARFLQKLGLTPGEFVGIYKHRNINFLIAILAIHKAGGGYVPIDSSYPLDRIQYMLINSAVRFLLTDQLSVKPLDEFVDRCSKLEHVICLDTVADLKQTGLEHIKVHDLQDFQTLSQDNLEQLNQSAAPAYMLYTSGSTGLPKGAIIRHDGAVNHIYAQLDDLALREGFSFLQSAPASSDISVWQFLGPLLTGGKTVVVDTETVCNPEKLFQIIQTEALTLVELVPVVLKGLLDYVSQQSPQQRSLPTLKCMMITGEYVSVELVNQWLHVYPNIPVANAYGPTEAADDITQCVIDKPLPDNQRTVPIGKPLANLRLYVLDADMQLAPVGVPGEICVSGIGVGNGYWNNEEKTALSFVPNPYPDTKHPLPANNKDLLYKTGDLGRWLPDGNLEFLGRIDNQVKIRGFRIELGEIEARLMQHPSVQEAVVIVRDNSLGSKSLVAYIIKSSEHRLSTEDGNHQSADDESAELITQLRHFLKEKLPEHMVPSAFVQLDQLPLTPNGKVDRRALPEPAKPNLEKDYVAPRTEIEKTIAEIWQQILGLEKIGIHDNFFELGGHSLLITQLFTRLQNTFEVRLTLRTLFDAPTIAKITEDIQRSQQAPPGTACDQDTIQVDFAAEAVLDSAIQPEGLPYDPTTPPVAIFLTGATGFLGAFLLHELLQRTQADIYCLVRSSDGETGKQKIQQKLESYLIWDHTFSSRIIPIVGDLSQPLLGLSEQQFQELAVQLDAIYHSGALVNSMSPYGTFKAANVLGTQEVLRLASQTKVKPVHFVSSTGVVPSGNAAAGTIQENGSLDTMAMPGSGYAQSKRVAEKLVTIARDRGLPVSIYRPGFITGHSQTGVCNTSDIIYRMIKGCIQIESMPNLNVNLDLNPCDYVSQAIVHLSQQPQSLGNVFHLVNPQPLSMSIVCQYIASRGYPIEFVDYGRWQSHLVTKGNSPENALYPLLPMFPPHQENISLEAGGVNTQEKPVEPKLVVQPFDAKNTLTGLADSIISCPILDDQLLNTYFEHLVEINFLPVPKIAQV